MGLWHSFQSGCSFPNDFVADTAPQHGETSGCPSSMDSLYCRASDFRNEVDRGIFQQQQQQQHRLNVHRRNVVNLMDYAGKIYLYTV